MKKIVFIFSFLLAFCSHAPAQLSFHRVDTIKVTDQSSPLINAWAGGFNFPMFCEMDLNNDGIMDIIVYENGGPPGHRRIMPFLNNGAAGQVDYHYAPEYISKIPGVKGFLVTFDYNYDGKMDVFSLSDATNAGIMVYRNTGTSDLQFTKVKDPILSKYAFGSFNVFASQISVPALCDVDNDGDMDIISWPPFPNGSLEYQRNLAVDSGWSKDSLRFKNVTQCWGGFALEVGTLYNRVASFGISCRETDPDTSFHWDRGMMANDDTQSVVMIFDNDGDGDKEALIGGYADNNALLVVNGGTTVKDSMVSQDEHFPSYDVPVDMESFPFFFYLDVNNNGAKDLIVTPHSVSNFRGIVYYKNTGTTAHPVFARQSGYLLQEDMIEVGAAAAPQLFDYDADGIPDLVIGDESWHDTSGVDHKGLALYKNVGTLSNPQFQFITRDCAGIDALNGINGTICPTFGDLDGDGDVDMLTGYKDGGLLYFENSAGANNPASFIPPFGNFQGIDVGLYSAPQLYDLNHDGLLDLVVGNSGGIIKYYENTGNTTAPVFTLRDDSLGGIVTKLTGSLTGYASPFFYDDNDTDKLVVGTESGMLYIYDNINGNILGNYHLADSIINGEEGQRLIPFIGDINHDGHPDLLVGNYNGGLSLYMNNDTALSVGMSKPSPVRPSFSAFPNPASDELKVSFYHIQNDEVTVAMMNNLGQVVYAKNITAPTLNIPVNSLSEGIYLLRFVCNGNLQTQKILIQKR